MTVLTTHRDSFDPLFAMTTILDGMELVSFWFVNTRLDVSKTNWVPSMNHAELWLPSLKTYALDINIII